MDIRKENCRMDVTLKTTSFGGYDKKAVENYIDELTAEHERLQI